MEDGLSGGAGTGVISLVSGFVQSNNYLSVNMGQVKTIAKPFYDRLGLSYPWADAPSTNDYGAVNVGQLKNIFAFPVHGE